MTRVLRIAAWFVLGLLASAWVYGLVVQARVAERLASIERTQERIERLVTPPTAGEPQ